MSWACVHRAVRVPMSVCYIKHVSFSHLCVCRRPILVWPLWAVPWVAQWASFQRTGSLPSSSPPESKEVREATSQVLALILTISLPLCASVGCTVLCVCFITAHVSSAVSGQHCPLRVPTHPGVILSVKCCLTFWLALEKQLHLPFCKPNFK